MISGAYPESFHGRDSFNKYPDFTLTYRIMENSLKQELKDLFGGGGVRSFS